MKDFIPYEEALALKELGFDEPCFGYFITSEPERFLTTDEYHINSEWEKQCPNKYHSAPLYQQAFRWFREKHQLHSEIRYQDDVLVYGYMITELKRNTELVEQYRFTYEEAELACIRKLIELVKQKP